MEEVTATDPPADRDDLQASPSQLHATLTTFVGRSCLVSDTVDLVRDNRLVTLVGPGGIGKTRLSLKVRDVVAADFADGAAVVDLDVVQDPTDVAWRTATAVRAAAQTSQPPLDQVIAQLADKHLLLVLDNCEHLVGAVGDLIAAVLESCPQVHILTTSREYLGLRGEHVVSVPPMGLPDSCADLEAVQKSEAVQLLVARAAQAGATVEVTEDTCEDVVALCRQLDGMPLAIELAAVRLRSLTVCDVLDRLEHRFQLLRGSARDTMPRHRTLDALVDWSYQLCSDQERLVWGRLAVCLSGADLEMAEAIAGFGDIDQQDVVDILDSLVTKSVLIMEEHRDQARYRQLVTIREFGERMARERGEWEELLERRAAFLLGRAKDLRDLWAGPRQNDWLARIRRQMPDVISTLDWAMARPETRNLAALLVSRLRYFWASGYMMNAGRYRLERVLDTEGIADQFRCECHLVCSWVALLQGDHEDAARHLTRAAELVDRTCTNGSCLPRNPDDPVYDTAVSSGCQCRRQRAEVHTFTGLLHLFAGTGDEDLATAITEYRTGTAVLWELGATDAWLAAMFQLGLCQHYFGDEEGAAETCRALLAESDRVGESWARSYGLWVQAMVHRSRRDLEEARALIAEALQLNEDIPDAICVAHLLAMAAGIALEAQDPARSLRLQDLSDAVWLGMGTGMDAFGPWLLADSVATRQRLAPRRAGDPDGAALRQISSARAARLGREEVEAITVHAGHAVRLTKRQTQVAELLAEGLSNKQIARKLVISTRTVDGHVEQILAKYGANSRAQVAVRFREESRF